MIPDTLNVSSLSEAEEYQSAPDKTYRLDFVNKRIIGKIDGKDAVSQFIKKVLDTDKYAYDIYDWYYGNEILTLLGMPYEYAVTECPRIVREALTVDDRILEVTNFVITQSSVDSLSMSFTVKTVYGDIKYAQEVTI